MADWQNNYRPDKQNNLSVEVAGKKRKNRALVRRSLGRGLLLGVLLGDGESGGFVGGLLYGILKGWSPEDCLHFGWATGAMATTMIEDFATPVDEDQVWNVWKGNARVKR